MSVLLSVVLGASPLRAVLSRGLRVRLRRWKGWRHGLHLILMMQLGKPAPYLRLLLGKGREKGESP